MGLCDWSAGRLAGHQLIFAWITVGGEKLMLIWATAKVASHFQMPEMTISWLVGCQQIIPPYTFSPIERLHDPNGFLLANVDHFKLIRLILEIVLNLLVQISISIISLRVLHRNKTNDSRTVNIRVYANVLSFSALNITMLRKRRSSCIWLVVTSPTHICIDPSKQLPVCEQRWRRLGRPNIRLLSNIRFQININFSNLSHYFSANNA